jgi:WD40 repeat protein
VVTAARGMGGIGKSALAARYAGSHAGRWNLAWWITADTPASMQAGLAGLATALLPELAAALPLGELEKLALEWLEAHDGWLLVLDDVKEPADVTHLPASGQMLLTSRLSEGWQRLGAATLLIDALTEDQAVQLLSKITARGIRRADLTGAGELVRELGCLPLAVEQAAAYMRQEKLSPRAYLSLLALTPAVAYDCADGGTDAERAIARIWPVTLDRLLDTPLAVSLLRILAWCAPDNIPRALLDPLSDSGLEVPEALGVLAAYSMISLDGDSIAVHRLVQAVARTSDPADPYSQPDQIERARLQGIRLLSHGVSGDREDPALWPAWRRLLPHVEAQAALAEPADDNEDASALFGQIGIFLNSQGCHGSGIGYLRRSLAGHERLQDADGQAVTFVRSMLALACLNAGNVKAAAVLSEQVLASRERVLGADHPDTLAWRALLAQMYTESGDLRRAAQLAEQTLAGRERVSGPDHPDTLSARESLGAVYFKAGNLDRAVPLLERTLEDSERILGPDHPGTFMSRRGLAVSYGKMRQFARAVELLQDALAGLDRVLGPDHPETLSTGVALADTYRHSGDVSQAIPLLERILADRERVLGPEHRQTLESRSRLGSAYCDAGRLDQAIELYAHTLADRERVLGSDHPDTLESRNNLAYALHQSGGASQAARLYERLLVDATRVLGSDHPDVLMYRNNLATACQDTGDCDRAVELHEVTIAVRERLLGNRHIETLHSRHNLAMACQAAGDTSRAISLERRTLKDCEQVLGADDAFTVLVRRNLHDFIEETGSASAASGDRVQRSGWLNRDLTGEPRVLKVTDRAAVEGVFKVAFSPGGGTLASGGTRLRAWDVPTGRHLLTYQEYDERKTDITAMVFGHSGKLLASSRSGTPGIIQVHDVHSGCLVKSLSLDSDSGADGIAFSPDDKMLIAASNHRIASWDLASGHSVPLSSGMIVSIAFSSDEQSMAGTGYDQVMMWRTEGDYENLSKPLRKIEFGSDEIAYRVAVSTGPEKIVAALCPMKDGKVVLDRGSGAICIWDCADGRLCHRIDQVDPSGALALSPHGDVIASIGRKEDYLASKAAKEQYAGGVSLWETSSGQPAGTLECDALSIAFSSDGTFLAVGGVNQITIWTSAG